MTKATHSGTCQACGSVQKLPGGVLANHGYTVRWSTFVGTCPGSGRRPFETHTDYVEQCIDLALAAAKDLRAQAAQLSKPAREPKAWYHQYVPATTRGAESRYRWVLTTLRTEQTMNDAVVAVLDDGTVKRVNTIGKDLRMIATDMNRVYAVSLANDAKKRDEYVAWQRERLAGWTVKPLLALADEAPKKTTTRTVGAKVQTRIGGKVVTGTVESSHRDAMWTMVTVKLDGVLVNGSKYYTTRQSWLALVAE